MTRIQWGSLGTRKTHSGVDHGVFYPQVGPGVPWDGLINVKEAPSGGEARVKYVDGVPYRLPKTKESFAAVLQAYTSPREFDEYEGVSGLLTQQERKTFGLSYRTMVGDDISGTDASYLIHLVYNAFAMPTAMDSSTINNSLEAIPFSWGLSTTPIAIPGAMPAAHLIIDASIAYPEAIAHLENVLYGSDEDVASLPSPQGIFDIVEEHSLLMIIDHGDGSWTAIGPDEAIEMLDPDTFQITWPSAVYLDADTYQISSL